MARNPELVARVAATIDHTLLAPEATIADAAAACDEGKRLGVRTICLSPSLVTVGAVELAGTALGLTSVVGFPSGAHTSGAKVGEAIGAVADGATELDMVINLGWARARRWDEVQAEVAAVRNSIPEAVTLKVIIEAASLDAERIVAACRAAAAGGAQFVKTSTGFHPAGGATVDAVRLMVATVCPGLEVKASGGIRSAEQALAMLEAGASRLGLSGSATVLRELDGPEAFEEPEAGH
jgi:deoxyribose-phosphate aldolase